MGGAANYVSPSTSFVNINEGVGPWRRKVKLRVGIDKLKIVKYYYWLLK